MAFDLASSDSVQYLAAMSLWPFILYVELPLAAIGLAAILRRDLIRAVENEYTLHIDGDKDPDGRWWINYHTRNECFVWLCGSGVVKCGVALHPGHRFHGAAAETINAAIKFDHRVVSAKKKFFTPNHPLNDLYWIQFSIDEQYEDANRACDLTNKLARLLGKK